jgi:hypothetical protein
MAAGSASSIGAGMFDACVDICTCSTRTFVLVGTAGQCRSLGTVRGDQPVSPMQWYKYVYLGSHFCHPDTRSRCCKCSDDQQQYPGQAVVGHGTSQRQLHLRRDV